MRQGPYAVKAEAYLGDAETVWDERRVSKSLQRFVSTSTLHLLAVKGPEGGSGEEDGMLESLLSQLTAGGADGTVPK